MNVTLHLGDCLEIMPTLPMVDAIITDLPYGTTACSWDEVIPFAPMWEQVKRILKPRGVFVTTASQPFTSKLVMSNAEWFKYSWIWDKRSPVGHLNVHRMPMGQHEDIVVFGYGPSTYNPQYGDVVRKPEKNVRVKGKDNQVYGSAGDIRNFGVGYPKSILSVPRPTSEKFHPTQKPVALYEYLILTYTNPGDTVLDICAGSGTTGVACVKTGRNFIGIEKRTDYFAIMERRIELAQAQPMLWEEQ
jgi:site-specific DNA-methyltransferase (adenine-specific)